MAVASSALLLVPKQWHTFGHNEVNKAGEYLLPKVRPVEGAGAIQLSGVSIDARTKRAETWATHRLVRSDLHWWPPSTPKPLLCIEQRTRLVGGMQGGHLLGLHESPHVSLVQRLYAFWCAYQVNTMATRMRGRSRYS